ncbi:MAG: GlxA family transcriptional regulator [Reyranellaceae bacterium]
MPRLVTILLFEEANLFTLSCLHEVFYLANFLSKKGEEYVLQVCSLEGGIVHTREGLPVVTDPIADFTGKNLDTLIVGGGAGYEATMRNQKFLTAVKKGAQLARRVACVGAGVFVGAEAGLFDGKRATIHPTVFEEFCSRFPAVKADSISLYTKDGKLWSAPGMASAVDLALACVEEDLGYPASIDIARYLVIYMRRHETQSQISLMLDFQSRTSRFFKLNQWIIENLGKKLSIDQLAARANMSRRTLSRLYTKEMGKSPAKMIAQLRIEAALIALRDSNANMASIAYQCGFDNEDRMRRAFLLAFGKPPSVFRQKRRVSD